MNIKNVSVIGAGTMGNGIAHVFAQSGYKVTMIDVQQAQLDKALATISKNLDRQVSKGLLKEEHKSAALGNITTHTSIAEGVASAQLVVEAATENIQKEREYYSVGKNQRKRNSGDKKNGEHLTAAVARKWREP